MQNEKFSVMTAQYSIGYLGSGGWGGGGAFCFSIRETIKISPYELNASAGLQE